MINDASVWFPPNGHENDKRKIYHLMFNNTCGGFDWIFNGKFPKKSSKKKSRYNLNLETVQIEKSFKIYAKIHEILLTKFIWWAFEKFPYNKMNKKRRSKIKLNHEYFCHSDSAFLPQQRRQYDAAYSFFSCGF